MIKNTFNLTRNKVKALRQLEEACKSSIAFALCDMYIAGHGVKEYRFPLASGNYGHAFSIGDKESFSTLVDHAPFAVLDKRNLIDRNFVSLVKTSCVTSHIKQYKVGEMFLDLMDQGVTQVLLGAEVLLGSDVRLAMNGKDPRFLWNPLLDADATETELGSIIDIYKPERALKVHREVVLAETGDNLFSRHSIFAFKKHSMHCAWSEPILFELSCLRNVEIKINMALYLEPDSISELVVTP